MSLPYDKERCTGLKVTDEGAITCAQRNTCLRYTDKGHPTHQCRGNGAVKINETCDKKIEVKL